MPECWEEFAGDEVRWALAETRHAADAMLDLAHSLEVKLPGTREAFRTGVLRQSKAEIIARATDVLDPAEAQAAEALVLGRAGRRSPGGLRAAIVRAVIEVAPDKARKRREEAVRDARVERWPEDSGNAALAGRELPPAEVLAADQRITWWARQLKAAGLAGTMDELRPVLTSIYCSIRTLAPPSLATAPQTARPVRTVTARTARTTMETAAHPRRTRPNRGPRPNRSDPPNRGPRPDPACSPPGSSAGTTSPSRWPLCSSWPTGPASSPASDPSIPPWPGTWPAPPPPAPRPPGA